MEARRLKNMYGVNGTAILLDSTLSAANPAELPPDGNGPNYAVRKSFGKELLVSYVQDLK